MNNLPSAYSPLKGAALFAATLALLLLAGIGNAKAADAPTAELLAGCAACHGTNGEGKQALSAPPLAGQDSAYLARQLSNFKAARRGYAEADQSGQQMRTVAATLGELDIVSLAAHFSALPAVKLTAQAGITDTDGAARYQSTCALCHGQRAQGYPQMQAPNLSILGGWYIDQQLASYVKGWRGDAAHSDIQGIWMRSIATHISTGQDRQAVVAYIESLGVSPSAEPE